MKYILAITGASGVVYGIKLLEELLARGYEVHLIISEAALIVLKHELDWDFSLGYEETIKEHYNNENLFIYAADNIAAKIASGSFISDAMIIVPCSMSTLASVAVGMSNNLIERAADVILKEKRTLVIMPRETPLSSIHLENMLKLSRMGVHIIPAMPAFYNNPKNIDDMIYFLIGKIMDALKIKHNLFARYEP